MNQEELDIIVDNHEKWLRGEGDARADLRLADLSYADLRCADLRGADLRGADLRWANLSYADLREVDLSDAKLNWINWQDVTGLTVVAVQVGTTRKNNQIAYIKELDTWTTS
ncbi:pentapeptide repeat-containing protein, partial [Listeria monocytogenes]